MSFRSCIDAAFPAAVCLEGKKALRSVDSDKIRVRGQLVFAYSVDLDACTKKDNPSDNRWDYRLALTHSLSGEYVAWVEVHPASTSDISAMLLKKKWLQTWLAEHAKSLFKRMGGRLHARNCFWVASGGINIPKHHRRKFAQSGLMPRSILFLEQKNLDPLAP